MISFFFFFFFQAEDGIRDFHVTGVQTCALPICGYYAGLPPGQGDNWTHYYHNGALYSDPRISAYIGMGLHQMPGDVWWRSWRELPPPAPFTDCQSTIG